MTESRFCGPHINATKVGDGILANECFLDGLSFFPHILLILISLPILIAWNKSSYGGTQAQTWVHFPLHTFRWILFIILILLNLVEIGEGVISDSMFVGSHLHLYIPHCVALIGSLFSIIYYHNVESLNSPRFLLLLILYWVAGLIVKILKVIHLFRKGLGVEHLRFDLTWDVIIVYGLLLILELYILCSLVSVSLIVKLKC